MADASTIEQLNYEVILKDDKFQDKIQKVQALANTFNTTMTQALTVLGQFGKDGAGSVRSLEAALKSTTKQAEDLSKSLNGMPNKKISATIQSVNGLNVGLSTSNRLLTTLSQLTGVAFGAIGVRRFLSTLIDITGQFEVQKMALRNMLQDLDGADKIFEDLYNFSSQSTYRFSELAKYAKQLAAFNIDQSNLLETTKMLGDVASGVGVSMDRLILAYGHVKSSGFLRGIQLRSFSQNGVPILEELSKMFTEIEGKAVSLGDVFDKMTKREIGFEMVEEAFRRMTSEGGKFYQMQEVLAKTLSGQINILKGKWENLMYAIGESQDGILKGVVTSLTNIVSNMESFGNAVKEAIVVFAAYRAGLILTTVATEGLAAATNIGLLGAFKKAFAFIAKNPLALLAAGIALAVVEIVKVNNALSDTEKITKALNDETQKYYNSLANEQRELDILIGRVKAATEGTEEYSAAKAALEKRFDPYIQQLRNEGVAVSDLTALYSGLVTKIRDAQREKYLERAQTAIVDAYGVARDNIERSTQGIIKEISTSLGRQLTGLEEGSIRHYIETGEKNETFKSLSGVLDAPRFRRVGGSISTGPELTVQDRSFSDRLLELMNRETDAADTYATAMQDAAARFGQARKEIVGGEEAPENIIKITSVVEGIKKIDAELASLRNKAKSSGGITETEQKRIEALTEDREEQVKLYKSIMGSDYDKAVKSSAEAQEDAQKKERERIKASITLLEKYRDAREKLEPFFGAETGSQLVKIFGKSNDYDTLDEQIKKLCDDLRRLGDDGAQAAEQIEARLGLDKTSSIIKAQKALQKWQETLSKWMKDWGGGDYHGIEYDIDKVVREYNNEDSEITKDYNESLSQIIEAHWGNAEAIKAEIEALDRLVAARRAANANTQQEKLNDLASKYVKENTKNLNLRDWSDKSIRQVRDLYKTLSNLASGEVVIDETLRNRLTNAGLKIEDFSKLAKEEFEKLSESAKEELVKKFGTIIKEVTNDLNAVAKGIKEFADAAGDAGLSEAMEAFSFGVESIGNFAEKAMSGDWIGAVTGYVASLATAFFQAQAAVAKFDATLRAARETARRDNLLTLLGEDSIFGASGAGKVRNAIEVMQKARASMNASSQPGTFNRNRTFWDSIGMTGRRLSFSLSELADSVGRDLYDSYGNLNADTLQVILDAYDDLGQAEKEWITRAINDSEAYSKAMEQLDGVMESVFGNIASQATDYIVDTWAEGKDAVLDYTDSLDDVARAYAKLITQSMLIESVFTDDFKERLRARFSDGDTAGAMELIMDGMEQMSAMAPQITEALEPLRPYLKPGSSDSSNTLAAGISKELVEGNSTLIASYMNALRADVSVMRTMQTSGWQDVRLVRESIPTYTEYFAKIEANTYDQAQATHAILAKLQGIIAPSSNGGSAVRTMK